jgi:mercuric ion transport protein
LIDENPVILDRKRSLAATGGVIGAVLASSCCIGPIVLIALGASGPWIGKLTALKAYQPLFVGLTIMFLGYGFWRVYRKLVPDCGEGSCATPTSDRIVKVALWTATLLVIVALTTDLWAPLFY